MKRRNGRFTSSGKALPLLTAALSGLLLLAPVSAWADTTQPFTDISDSYAQQQILDLQQRGIVSGSNNQYFPHTDISRAEFVTMLDRTVGVQKVNDPIAAFTDVTVDQWYYPWVQASTQLGFVTGTGATTFDPTKPIIREDVAVAVTRALQAVDPAQDSGALPFSDANLVDSYATQAVAAVSRLGLMNGYNGAFRPKDNISREEMAVVLDRLATDNRWAPAVQNASTLPASGQVVLSWQYNESTAEYENRIQASQGMINTLSPRWFFLDTTGQFSDNSDALLAEWAHQNGKKIWPLVGNRFNTSATHQYLATDSSRQALVNQLVADVKKYQIDGLNIDFEAVDSTDRDNLTAFVSLLASQLHQINAQVSIDVPPDMGTDWDACYDYKALGQIVDNMVIMGYDEHWNGDPQSGSVSSMPWLTRAVTTIVNEVPPHKVVLGLPLYTTDWYYQNGAMNSDDITVGAESGILQNNYAHWYWNSSLGQYIATYYKNGVTHTIWVEDGRSLAQKYKLALQSNIGGTAYWYAGAESNDVWQSLQNVQKYDNFLQTAGK